MKLHQRYMVFAGTGSWLTPAEVLYLTTNGKFTSGVGTTAWKRIQTIGSPGVKINFNAGAEIDLKSNDFGLEDRVIDGVDEITVEITCPEITQQLLYTWLSKNPNDLDTAQSDTFKSGAGAYVGTSRLPSAVPLYIYAAKYDLENLTDFPIGCPAGVFQASATTPAALPPIGTAFFLPSVIFNRSVQTVGETSDGQQIVTITGKATRMASDTSFKTWFDGPLYKA